MQPKISVVTLTKDEAGNIRRCLESVKWADEIIIVDDASHDDTIKICREFTDKIFQNKMESFSEQRKFGIAKARGEWILILDADEEIPVELGKEIRETVNSDPAYDGFYIWQKCFYLGKWIRHCNWYLPVIKLIRKDKLGFDSKRVHEKIITSARLGYLNNPFLHYSYSSIEQHLKKMNFYTSLAAKDLFAQGVRVHPYNMGWYFVIRPVLVFLRKYFLMRGFLDGAEGLSISVFTGIVNFINYVKLWELQKNK
ncbi:MAG: glycosyltransferase family 2 protein [Candidatus Omnitrophica bacterium]|nr:glycosyltransferase family 2 protein [Candidatus Omnitrophota bacterium]MDD5610519.1 glycosyltransferase family 2 protein [Candidatus Omnitrophota bacterium]